MFPPRRAASLAASILAALLAFASSAHAADSSLDTTERWMLGQVNAARAAAGAPPLEASATLARAANGYATFLAAHPDLTGHEADGRTLGQRLDAVGWPTTGGYAEDVFTSRTEGAQDALDAWLASPAHRANLLDASLRAVGVARAGRSWVLDFSRACPSSASSRCAMTGDVGDASLPVGTGSAPASTSSTSTSTTAATAPAPATGTSIPVGATSGTGSASGATGATSTTSSSAAASSALRLAAVRTRGQVVSATVAVARARRRAVRVVAVRAGRSVALRLVRSRSLAGGRVARTYSRKLPVGTWRIHAQLRRTATA